MNDWKTKTKLVKAILEQDKRARNSDSFLYLRVLEYYARRNGVSIRNMSVPLFLTNMDALGFPGFETIRRTRQKIQADFPELAACEKVQDFRLENEQDYRAFALNKGSV